AGRPRGRRRPRVARRRPREVQEGTGEQREGRGHVRVHRSCFRRRRRQGGHRGGLLRPPRRRRGDEVLGEGARPRRPQVCLDQAELTVMTEETPTADTQWADAADVRARWLSGPLSVEDDKIDILIEDIEDFLTGGSPDPDARPADGRPPPKRRSRVTARIAIQVPRTPAGTAQFT